MVLYRQPCPLPLQRSPWPSGAVCNARASGRGCDRGAYRPTPSGFDFGADSTGEAPSSPKQAAGVSAEIHAGAT